MNDSFLINRQMNSHIISVVIPCRNEVQYIVECITAIYNADLPVNVSLNVFIVDGMSNDGTREVIFDLQKSYPTLELVDNTRQLTPFAFNLGIYAKPCDFVQIIGARHIISKNYIFNCYQKLQSDASVWCVGGKIVNEYINETGKIIALAMGTKLGMGIGNFRTLSQSGFTDTVTSPMYPYWVFEKIGFFDEELIRNQDDDFNYRVTNAGGKIFFDADISLKYYVRGNYKNLWKQFFQYGYWKVYVNQKHKTFTTIRQLVPPMFCVFIIFTFLVGFFSPFLSKISSLIWLLYVILVFITSFNILKEDSSIKGFNKLKLIATFPILHTSYGFGYLKGILHFIMLRKKPSDKQKQLSR